MARKESTIVYDKHVEICAEFLTDEQFGKLMFTLTMGKEPDFGDDKMLAMAFAFIALQKQLDDKKYERICETNRKNGAKGGAPKGNKNASKGKQPQNNLKTTSKQPNIYQENEDENGNSETLDSKGRNGIKQPKQPNAKKNNPKEKENEKEKENDNEKESVPDNHSGDHFSFFGEFGNVQLTVEERQSLREKFERSGALIDKVSVWLRSAKNHVPDHYGLCLTFADNETWPKKKVIEPAELPEVTDPLSEEDQDRMVASMRERLNGAFSSG